MNTAFILFESDPAPGPIRFAQALREREGATVLPAVEHVAPVGLARESAAVVGGRSGSRTARGLAGSTR